MTSPNDKLGELEKRLQVLLTMQADLSGSLQQLQFEIIQLKAATITNEPLLNAPAIFEEQHVSSHPIPVAVEKKPYFETPVQPIPRRANAASQQKLRAGGSQSTLEKFIGENLINKIGITIMVIGVAIGAKYSIERELISPFTRIILGYLMAAGLLGFGIRLKKNYENYSAVLVSGAIAIMYFITYAAFSYYNLMPRLVAFLLMLLFTGFGVTAAIHYNKQVISHIGLIGAYAVPFLLSENSGKVGIFFSYIAIINIGILYIAFKKYWKALYYSAFIITWLIFTSWYALHYSSTLHFNIALLFTSIFFALFYIVFLAYKLIKKEVFNSSDILLITGNGFIFYGLGYSLLTANIGNDTVAGLFTLINVLIHAGVSIVIYRQKGSDKNLFYLVAGLAIVFLTITIPVQFDGNWVTLLWIGETVIFFWIGRTKDLLTYERIAYPLIALAFASLLLDWFTVYEDNYLQSSIKTFIPFLNINFLSSLFFAAALGYINYLQIKHPPSKDETRKEKVSNFITIGIPASLVIVLYFTFRLELQLYFHHLYLSSFVPSNKPLAGEYSATGIYNEDIIKMQSVWIINYSLLFFTALSIINIKRIRNHFLAVTNLALNSITVVVFLTQGLYVIQQLTDSYQLQNLMQPVFTRYISYCFVLILLLITYWYTKQAFFAADKFKIEVVFDLLLYVTIVWIASAEVLYVMKMMHASQPGKLGLSILWGLYALFLIVIGIWKNKSHVRIGAIALFAVTLIKLFFYDLKDLNTLAKTLVFILLGILLLIVSFLYNKYKGLMNEERLN